MLVVLFWLVEVWVYLSGLIWLMRFGVYLLVIWVTWFEFLLLVLSLRWIVWILHVLRL